MVTAVFWTLALWNGYYTTETPRAVQLQDARRVALMAQMVWAISDHVRAVQRLRHQASKYIAVLPGWGCRVCPDLHESNRRWTKNYMYGAVMSKFDAFFKVHCNVIYEWASFNRWSQQLGETSEQFITTLYEFATIMSKAKLKKRWSVTE